MILIEKVDAANSDHRWVGVDATLRCQMINIASAEITRRARPGVRYTEAPTLSSADKRRVQEDAYRLALRERGGAMAAVHAAGNAARGVRSRTRALLWFTELCWTGITFFWTGRVVGFTMASAFFCYRLARQSFIFGTAWYAIFHF